MEFCLFWPKLHKAHTTICRHGCYLETDRIWAMATASAPKVGQKSVLARFRFQLTKVRPSYGYGRNHHRVSAACRNCTVSQMLSHQQARRPTNRGRPRRRLFRQAYKRLMTTWSKQQPPTKMKNFHRMNGNWRHISKNHVCHDWQTFVHACLTPDAHKYLSVPLTSVASEQLFSAARQLYADRRSNLNGSKAEKFLFLAYNIRLFGFN